MTNQKPVDDKDLVWQILDRAFTAGLNHEALDWPSYKSMKPRLFKQLNAHYQKKYLGLLADLKKLADPKRVLDVTEGPSKDWENGYNNMTEATRIFMLEINHAIEKALANIKSEGGE